MLHVYNVLIFLLSKLSKSKLKVNSLIVFHPNKKSRCVLMNAYFGSVDLTKASPITQIPLPMATLKKTVRVAAAQMTSVNDLIANFNTCSRLVQVNSFPD